jgi:hypothetical protein
MYAYFNYYKRGSTAVGRKNPHPVDLCREIVDVMDPAEHRRRNDVTADIALGRELRCTRRALSNRPVRPQAVEQLDDMTPKGPRSGSFSIPGTHGVVGKSFSMR